MALAERSFTKFLLVGSLFGLLSTSAFAQHVGTAAPNFISGGAWLNSEPLHVDDLRGKVVPG